MSLHVTSYSKRLAAYRARMRLLAGVYASMILQVAARAERFVAVVAAIVLLAGVDTPVYNQRVFPGKLFRAKFALIMFVFRMNARRVIF